MFLLGTGEKMYVLHDSAYDFPDGVEIFWLLVQKHLFRNG